MQFEKLSLPCTSYTLVCGWSLSQVRVPKTCACTTPPTIAWPYGTVLHRESLVEIWCLNDRSGLAATHDVALAELEAETGGRVRNVHFTDVLVDGEMVFDYRLRDGVVQTSNALRLLKLAGVDVPDGTGDTI